MPEVDANDYFIEDEVAVAPKHGTTVQAGWGAMAAATKPKRNTNYPTDFKFSDKAQLVRFLDDEPFAVYKQHWVQLTAENGKDVFWRSFVCTGSETVGEECPLCTIAGDIPRSKAAFNVLHASSEEPSVQILTAPVTLARQLQAAHEDPRRGPLSKYYWALSRHGSGRETQYTVDRVRASELAEEWELDPDTLDELSNDAVKYDSDSIYVSPREEMVKAARQLLS